MSKISLRYSTNTKDKYAAVSQRHTFSVDRSRTQINAADGNSGKQNVKIYFFTVTKMFRTYEDTSFGNYLMKIRVEKAEKMMRQDPDAYIRDIAERCGYSDQFYFSRIFRSVTGSCPKEYMEKMK